jgi:hypothetical protein
MELKSFKEILLKKADGNPYLQTLIKYAKDELIAEEVVASLIKMAEPSAAMGRGANSALTLYAGQMDNSDVEQMRDALGHHISRYRGALKSMHAAQDSAEKLRLRNVADQHLSKVIPLMHLAGRAGKHSNGKMTLDYVSTTPWESNYTTVERHPHNGKLKEGTKDLGRRPSRNASRDNPRAVRDYRYLEMAPHAQHASTEKMPHKGGYPFEETQLGAPAKKDAGQAYLPLEDLSDVKDYVPHPFDHHPIHEVADHAEHHLTPEQKEKFINDLAAWKGGEHHKKWLADQKAKYQANPDAYKARGSAKPAHHFEGIPLQEQPEHARTKAATPPLAAQASPTNVTTLPAQGAPAAQSDLKATKAKNDQEEFNSWWSKISPADQRAMLTTPHVGDMIRERLKGKK